MRGLFLLVELKILQEIYLDTKMDKVWREEYKVIVIMLGIPTYFGFVFCNIMIYIVEFMAYLSSMKEFNRSEKEQ